MRRLRRVRRPLLALVVLVAVLVVGYLLRSARSDDHGMAPSLPRPAAMRVLA